MTRRSSAAAIAHLSVVIPALNEEVALPATLAAVCATLAAARADRSAVAASGLASHVPLRTEIVVADGGSTDRTAAIAAALGAVVVHAPRGRGPQLRAGAAAARGDTLWLLHADTRPHVGAAAALVGAVADGVVAGCFAVRFDGDGRASRFMDRFYGCLRACGLVFGDAGIFATRAGYDACGGVLPYPVFEDLDLVRRLRRAGPFRRLDVPLWTSSRRFAGRRFAPTMARWVVLQVLYWLGVSPYRLGRGYRPEGDRGRRGGERRRRTAAGC